MAEQEVRESRARRVVPTQNHHIRHCKAPSGLSPAYQPPLGCRTVCLILYAIMRIFASMKIEPIAMEAAADQASELLKSLANRHRLLILCQLADGERSVGELAAVLGARDSTVSQHLALLRKDSLVRARREAQTIYYSIAAGPAQRVLETLFEIYCAPVPMCADPAAPAKPKPPARPRRTARKATQG
jgi:DNA-binding transcriptional ArsR family regulator